MTIHILCLGCNKPFQVNHPSIKNVRDLARIKSLQCDNCNAQVGIADYHAVVEPLSTKNRRKIAPVGITQNTAKKGSSCEYGRGLLDIDPCTNPPVLVHKGITYCSAHLEHVKEIVSEPGKVYTGLPNAPLSTNDELAALRDQLAKEKK